METPTPVPPAATENAALTITALIAASLVAITSTLSAKLMVLSSMYAFVLVRITLDASAPAPLIATPVPPKPAPTAAAVETTFIMDVSSAITLISPLASIPWP